MDTVILQKLKGTVRIISSDSSGKDRNVRFTTGPLIPFFSDKNVEEKCVFFHEFLHFFIQEMRQSLSQRNRK